MISIKRTCTCFSRYVRFSSILLATLVTNYEVMGPSQILIVKHNAYLELFSYSVRYPMDFGVKSYNADRGAGGRVGDCMCA